MNLSKAKILIMVPQYSKTGEEHRKYVLPVGLAYIFSVLKRSNYEV